MARNTLTMTGTGVAGALKAKELAIEAESPATNLDKIVITFWLLAAWKGGIGKSTTVRLMAETCLAKAWPFLIIDTDLGTESLVAQTYDGVEIQYVDENKNIDDAGKTAIFDAVNALLDRASMGDNKTPRHVIFDLGAGEITRFSELMEKEGLFFRISEEGHKIRFVAPLDGSDDPFPGMRNLLQDTAVGSYLGAYAIDVSVFLNAARGAADEKAAANRVALIDLKRDFPLWERSALRKQVLDAGWNEIHLPVLESTTAWTRWHSANREAADTGKPLTTMVPWMRSNIPEARRDQYQMTRWHNRFVPELAKWMES